MVKKNNIVILAAGQFPTHSVPLGILQSADVVVCCDSAYQDLRNYSQKQGLLKAFRELTSQNSKIIVVGDGDSLPDDMKRSLGDRWLQNNEQDYNDLHKAIQWATSNFRFQNSNFTILGATGRREDHAIGNISYLVTFAEEYPGIDVEIIDDYGRFCAFQGCRRFDSFAGQQISIFTLSPQTVINSRGLQYPLQDFHATRWWQATLNCALADSFELSSDDWLIVFRTHEAK